jgi:hypothetical protein
MTMSLPSVGGTSFNCDKSYKERIIFSFTVKQSVKTRKQRDLFKRDRYVSVPEGTSVREENRDLP